MVSFVDAICCFENNDKKISNLMILDNSGIDYSRMLLKLPTEKIKKCSLNLHFTACQVFKVHTSTGNEIIRVIKATEKQI